MKGVKGESRVGCITKDVKLFIMITILIFFAWLPYLIKYFPGIIVPDGYWQMSQSLGIDVLDDHHPILHTFIIGICANIGKNVFNNINVGVLIYSLTSMIIMALLDTIVIMYLKKKNAPKIILAIIMLFYMFYPVNGIYSISMMKDTLFSGIVPIFIIICYELISMPKEFLDKKSNRVIFIMVSLLTMLLRHNGLYVVIITMPFMFIPLKEYWKELIKIFAMILIIYEILNIMVFNILRVRKGSVAEMLSIPLQQIARVDKYHRDEVEENIKNNIDKIFVYKNIGQYYNPILSDAVKGSVDMSYFNENKKEIISTYISLFARYPKDYIESFISNSYGYYYPEAMITEENKKLYDPFNNRVIICKHDGDYNNFGTNKGSSTKESINKIFDTYDIPIISMLYSPGLAFWMLMICLGYTIYNKKYKEIVIYVPIIVLWLTCVASPVFCEYRYAYPMFLALPIYIALHLVKKNKNEKKEIKNGKN